MSGMVGRFRGRRKVRWWIVAGVAAPVAAFVGVGIGTEALPPPHWVGSASNGGAVAVSNQTANPDAGVVDISTQLDGQARGAGSGIVLTQDGTVLTNNHVIDGATNIQVTDVANGRTYSASVTGYDVGQDVAVLHLVGASGLSTEPLGDSSRVGSHDAVMAVGNAGGRGGSPAHSNGEVSGRNESITAGGDGSGERLDGMFQISAQLEPGDSGGPLLDSSGRVIGMDTATSEQDGHVNGPGYAIPINTALHVSDQIRSGRVEPGVHQGGTGLLGVGVASPSALDSETGTGSEQAGAAILSVSPDSGAQDAGLMAGDVITSIDGQQVSSPEDLTNLVREHQPGNTVRVDWTGANGQDDSAEVQLGSGPPA